MQRYIKKIGYKQDLKGRMLSSLIRKRSYTKSINTQEMAISHTFKYLTKPFPFTINFKPESIYKSLTLKYIACFFSHFLIENDLKFTLWHLNNSCLKTDPYIMYPKN